MYFFLNFLKKKQNKSKQRKKIWNVSTQLSEHLFAIRHLNKLETESISIYKQSKSNI